MIELLYDQLKLIFWKINFKIKFELKITLFLISEFYAMFVLINTKNTLSLLFNAMKNEGTVKRAIKVWNYS